MLELVTRTTLRNSAAANLRRVERHIRDAEAAGWRDAGLVTLEPRIVPVVEGDQLGVAFSRLRQRWASLHSQL